MKTRKPKGTGSPVNGGPTAPTQGEEGLGKDVQVSLGAQLRRHYQTIVEEGVPDRFVELLQRYDRKLQKHPAEGSADAGPFVENEDHDNKDKDPGR